MAFFEHIYALSKRAKLVIILSFVPIFFFFLLISNQFRAPFYSAIRGWDNSFYYFWLRSAFVDHDFDFENDIKETNTLFWEGGRKHALSTPRTSKGLLPNKYAIGWAVSSVPFYIIADGLVLLLNTFGANLPRDGYNVVYQFIILLGQFCYGLASLYLSYRVLLKWFDKESAFAGVILAWFSGFLFFYQAFELSMAHNITFFAIASIYFITHQIERKPRPFLNWALLGIMSGLLVISRYQAAVYLLYPLIMVIKSLRVHGYNLMTRILFSAVCALLMLSLQLGAWKIVYGSWILYTYTGETFNWLRPELWNVLFSSYHGLFYWSPAYLIALLGLVLFSRKQGGVSWCFMTIFLSVYYINASWYCWWFAWSFGARAFEGCVLFFMIGIASLYKLSRNKIYLHRALIGVLIVSAIVNVSATYAAVMGTIPLNDDSVTFKFMFVGILNAIRNTFHSLFL